MLSCFRGSRQRGYSYSVGGDLRPYSGIKRQDYRNTAASFQFIHSLIESKMVRENTLTWLSNTANVSVNGRPEESHASVLGLKFELGFVQVKGSVVILRVRVSSWRMTCVYDRPHKDRNTRRVRVGVIQTV